jgi:hypothetical protein
VLSLLLSSSQRFLTLTVARQLARSWLVVLWLYDCTHCK